MNINIINERDLTSKQHDEIHILLNNTFENTVSFTEKSYGAMRPSFRILLRDSNNKLIGHVATFLNIRIAEDRQKINYAGIGLLAIDKTYAKLQLSKLICKVNLKAINKRGFDFALARSNHTGVIALQIKTFKAKVVDIMMIGNGKKSKADDKLLIISTTANKRLSQRSLQVNEFFCSLNCVHFKARLF